MNVATGGCTTSRNRPSVCRADRWSRRSLQSIRRARGRTRVSMPSASFRSVTRYGLCGEAGAPRVVPPANGDSASSVDRPMPSKVAALAKLFCSAIVAKADISANSVPRIVLFSRTTRSNNSELSHERKARTVSPIRSGRCANRWSEQMKIKRRDVLKIATVTCLTLGLHAGEVSAQPISASARQQFVGTWSLVSIQYIEKDGPQD